MADTARSAAALKLFFETGDIPTQQQFADFITSYSNLTDNNALDLSDLAITAHAGGGQGSAYQVTKRLNQITTVATAGDSLKLPAALAGVEGVVFNTQTNSANIFPTLGDNFVNSAANAALALPGGYVLFFYCTYPGQMLFYVLSDAGVPQSYPFVTATSSPLSVLPSLYSTYVVTALANSLTISAPSSVFASGQDLTIMITDNGTSRTLTWNAAYVAGSGSLPTATIASTLMIFKFKYDAASAKWICINTSANGYFQKLSRVYRAYVTQTGTAAPVATVFENETGQTISWSRLGVGIYTLTTTDLFQSGKYFVKITAVSSSVDDVNVFFSDNFGDEPQEVYVNHVDDNFSHTDGCKFFIEIMVYP